jgi:serine/threonine protein kinase
MSRDLGPCPPADDLERLLTEQLSAAERETVEMHVENCTTCQQRLDRMSETPARTARQQAPNAGQWPEPSAEFLRRLRETPPPSTSGSSASNSLDISAAWRGGRVGQYDILEKLGKGGMGTVYKARHVELGKIVALKVLPTRDLDEIRVERFKNEVRAIGRLDHPHIVAAHDAGQASGVHFLVMELVDGEDLGRVVDRHGRLAVADACEVIRQAATGLQHAYERGLVHRDIKPGNLMLTRAGRVQVLDLGLARSFQDRAAERLTADGMVLGTADYLAPEQWEQSHTADIRADIYSLGCTLFHLLAGTPPFAGRRFGSLLQKLRGHVDTPPPPITGVREDVPAGLVAVLDRMLAKDPADRYATPAEVAEALSPFAAGTNLARLVGSGTPSSASSGPDTANLPSTLTENRSRARKTSSERTRRYALPLALAGLVAALAIAAIAFWPTPDDPSRPRMPASIVELRVKHYADKGKTDMGDLRTGTRIVRVDDRVRIDATLNVAAYYYLIAFNPQGSKGGVEELCLPDGADGSGVPGSAPTPRLDVNYPRDDQRFRLDAPGLQVFVLAASSRALPPYEKWRNEAGQPPWEGTAASDGFCWHFDGRGFRQIPRDRGELVDGPPKELVELRNWFQGRPEFDAVQIIAIPVKNGEK